MKGKRSPKLGKGAANFARTFSRSMTDLRFFREARRQRPGKAIGYLAVLLILFWLIPFSIEFFIGLRKANDAVVSGIRTHVPADARFVMSGGELTTTLEEPIVVEEGGFTFIVNASSTSLSLEEDSVGLAINRDAIVQREGPDAVQVIGYQDFPDFEVDRRGLDAWVAGYGPWLVLLIVTVTLIAFTLAVGVGFGLLTLIHALLFSLAMRALKVRMRFSSAFSVAVHAATVPVVVRAVADWSGADIGSAATYLYWILLAFIAYDFRKEAAHGNQKTSPEADRAPEGGSGGGRQ